MLCDEWQTPSRFERDMFAIWARVHFSIFTVQREAGAHLMLDDRIRGETVVTERTASKTLHRGDIHRLFEAHPHALNSKVPLR